MLYNNCLSLILKISDLNLSDFGSVGFPPLRQDSSPLAENTADAPEWE